MKKTLALVLAFVLVFSTVTVAFAEEATIGADAKVCADLGMLVGDGSGVTAAYLATTPTRLQAAVMFLRLKGLEAEAKAFTGTENFADGNIAWAEGKAMLTYLKAHPELGWQGDGKNFNPNAPMTAQAYYKVLLESLGYKQNSATVVGDFAYESTITFAASKGLTKVATVANFTVNDLAAATVEALKGTVKDTTKTLAASLVDAGKVDKAKAIAAGVYVDTTTSTAKLDSAKAVANDKVKVTFNADAAKEYAENLANYKVAVKGATTALEVKAVTVVSPTVVELTTTAQTSGTAYTVTVADVTKSFTGIAKDSGAPEVDDVTCLDTNVVEVKFTKALDKVSAEDVANYTINGGATVKKAELWEDTFDNRKVVKLTTEGVAKNKVYKLKVANVKSADLVAIKTVEKSFAGITDTTAPKIEGNVTVKNNQRIIVNFNEGLDEATLENLTNWTIDGLKITSIVAKEQDDTDDYTEYDQAEVNTEAMESNKKYTLTITNLVDDSTSKNAIAKALTKTFYGVSVDKTAPKAGSISVFGDSMIEVPFTDSNRLNEETLLDINNYSFTEGLKVVSAKLLKSGRPDSDEGKTVVLTTSTMDKDTTYKITIENIADEFGNVMTKVSNRSIARSNGSDIAPPVVEKVQWLNETQVRLFFSEKLDIESATDLYNYELSSSVGKVIKAEISSKPSGAYLPYERVVLTVPKMTANKSYTVTVNGVKDRLGNVMSSYKATFIAAREDADTDRPEIETITAENREEIRITFNEKLTITAGAQIAVDANSDGDLADTADFTATVNGANGQKSGSYDFAYTMDEGTTVVFTVDGGEVMANSAEMTIRSLTGVADRTGNRFVVDASDMPTFYGNSTANTAPEIDSIDQVDVRTLKIMFNEPVLLNDGTMYDTAIVRDSGNRLYEAFIDKDKEGTNEALSTLTLKAAANLTYEGTYTFDFRSLIDDYVGLDAKNMTTTATTAYKTLIEDKDGPIIDYVEPVNTNKIKVVYNESISTAGSFEVRQDGKKVAGVAVAAAVDGDDDTIVNLTLTYVDEIEAGEVYTLVPKTYTYDVANNHSDLKDISFDFVASAVAVDDYIQGVKLLSPTSVKVYFSADVTAGRVIQVWRQDGDGNDVKLVGKVTATATDVFTIALNEAMREETTYVVRVMNGVNEDATFEAYSFTGISSDGGIDVDANEVVTFSGWDTDNFVVKLVYDYDADGEIVAGEVYLVMPVGGQFVLGDVYSEVNPTDAASVLDFTTVNPAAVYTLQVYRTDTDLNWGTTSAHDDITEYVADINNNVEASVLYTKEFTQD